MEYLYGKRIVKFQRRRKYLFRAGDRVSVHQIRAAWGKDITFTDQGIPILFVGNPKGSLAFHPAISITVVTMPVGIDKQLHLAEFPGLFSKVFRVAWA
jgi:hypothetical protein